MPDRIGHDFSRFVHMLPRGMEVAVLLVLPCKEVLMSRMPKKPSEKKALRTRKMPDEQTLPAQPENFDKTTTPRRERMAREMVETSPEERMKQGR